MLRLRVVVMAFAVLTSGGLVATFHSAKPAVALQGAFELCDQPIASRVIVHATDMAQISAAGAALLKLVGPQGAPKFSVVYVAAGNEAAYIETLARRGIRAERDVWRCLARAPNDAFYAQQWHPPALNLPSAWDISTGSASVVIAIIDSGVDSDHPDLAGKIVPGYDFFNEDNNPEDDHGHGTHVAGIAAAQTNNGVGVAGVCWECKIMPLKVCSHEGGCPASEVADALYYAADHGAQVANMSLGGYYEFGPEGEAVDYAWSKGVVPVAAAGNSSSSAPLHPAAWEHVIAVGALAEDGRTRSAYSNYGPWVDLACPGDNILSTTHDGSYGRKWGTSMSSPNCAGVVALVRSAHPDWTNEQVRQAVEATARNLGQDLGRGLPDPHAALLFRSNPPAAPPTLTSTPTPQEIHLVPDANAVGWVVSAQPGSHNFGDDDVYAGFYGGNIYHGAFQFRLPSLLASATILEAEVRLTGQTDQYLNQAAGGAWQLKLLGPGMDAAWTGQNYNTIHNAAVVTQVGPNLAANSLRPNIENRLAFAASDVPLIADRAATTGAISFRIDGPTSDSSNVFSWDSGNVVSGEGLGKPPVLRIVVLPSGVMPTLTPSVTPSPTPSATRSVTPSATPSATRSVTPSATRSVTPSVTPVASPTTTPTAVEGVLVGSKALQDGTRFELPIGGWRILCDLTQRPVRCWLKNE